MFDLFRSQRKVVKFFLTFLLSLVALSMAVTLIPGLFSGQTATANLNDPVLVQVGDEAVTVNEVAAGLREYQRAGSPPDSLAYMARQIVDNLVSDKILLQEADKLGIKPNEAELADWIRDQMPFLWQGGQFNANGYRQMVQQRFGIGIPEFERNVLKDLTIELRLRQLVTDNIVLTDKELQELYADRNETAKIHYAVVDPKSFESQVEVTDEKIRNYFDSARFRYRVPEQRVVKVMAVDQLMVPETEFTDAQIRNFYNQNRYRFEKPERALVRQILFLTFDQNAGAELPEDQQKEKEAAAQAALERVNAGEDFATVAKELSEDEGTKEEGGSLGWIVPGQFGSEMADFDQAVFALQPGENSGVVKSSIGYHIVQVEKKDEPQTRSLDDARAEIVADLQVEREQTARMEQVDNVLSRVRAAGGLDEAGAQLGVPVQTYGPFGTRTMPADISKMPNFAGNIMSAPVASPVTYEENGTTYVAVVTEILPARDSEFAEVADQVRQDYIDAESRTLARERGEELLAAAQESGLEAAARRFGLKVETSDFFKRTGGVDGFATAQVMGDNPFDAEVGSVFGPVSAQSGVGVYAVADQAEADMSGFSQASEQLREQALKSRRDEAFNIFRATAQQAWQDSGRIQRYDDRIEQFVRRILNS